MNILVNISIQVTIAAWLIKMNKTHIQTSSRNTFELTISEKVESSALHYEKEEDNVFY